MTKVTEVVGSKWDSPTVARPARERTFAGMDTRSVPVDGSRLWVGDQPGEGTPIILMHGFPDNHHLYDRLLPHLAGRRVVMFDFLGWGDSDKPTDHAYTASAQVEELDRVIKALGLDRVILVAHDASGPPAIDWALAHPDRVERLVLLNTYYSEMPSVRAPEAIWVFSTPGVRRVARWVTSQFGNRLFRRMYFWQVGRFFHDPAVRDEYLPVLYEQFERQPSAQNAFYGLNEDLRGTLRHGTTRVPELRRFDRPVRVVFGEDDPYLNAEVARDIARLFPNAELRLIARARHFVQMDEPARVAAEIARS
jgi:pimeloyl-ACP methyl ester carboxylesterase